MSKPDPRLVAACCDLLDMARAARPGQPVAFGICGAQGSGKTTLSRALAAEWQREGLKVATLSLDDLYLTRRERLALARGVHPLLATRGVPGTHDIAMGMDVLDSFAAGAAFDLPLFDKGSDDRLPRERWRPVAAGCEVLILEGWCIGAAAQDEAELAAPVNALEREEDVHGVWRRHVNAMLRGPYAAFFARLTTLALLAAPGFEVVHGWRRQQEAELPAGSPRAMDEAALFRFIAHYERLTRHILREMPQRADLVAELDRDRRVVSLLWR